VAELARREAAAPGREFSNLLWPLRGGEIARAYGPGHRGTDFRTAEGEGVRAAADGVVVFAGTGLRGYGVAVVLRHEKGWTTVYGSLRETPLAVGDRVLRGQWVGRVGRVEPDQPPHLHLEWLVDGRHRDPQPHLVGAPGEALSL
jgi:murein DD-endopeptidase MepM/ murein hydrolase activator NlpD